MGELDDKLKDEVQLTEFDGGIETALNTAKDESDAIHSNHFDEETSHDCVTPVASTSIKTFLSRKNESITRTKGTQISFGISSTCYT